MSKDADDLYEARHNPDQWDDKPAAVTVRKRRSEVVSFRLPTAEMDALELAAADAGETLSEFVRAAVVRRIQGTEPLDAWADLRVGRASLLIEFKTSQRRSWAESEHPVSFVPDVPPTGVNTTA